MKRIIYLSALTAVMFFSCSDEDQKPKEDKAIAENSSNSLSIKEAGYDIQLSLDEAKTKADMRFEYMPAFGSVDFFLNENFHYTITLEDTDLSSIKAELETAGILSYKFYHNSDDELLFQGVLPDGKELGYNLVRKVQIKGKNYIIKSDPQAEYSREDIEKAKVILNSLS